MEKAVGRRSQQAAGGSRSLIAPGPATPGSIRTVDGHPVLIRAPPVARVIRVVRAQTVHPRKEAYVLTNATTASKPSAMVDRMLSDQDRYWPLLMTLTEAEKTDLEERLTDFGKACFDVRDPSFLEVFPPDIMAQRQHLIYFWIAQESVSDPKASYSARVRGWYRQVLIGLPPRELEKLDRTLTQYMTDREQAAYHRLNRTPRARLMMDPKPESYGLIVAQGIHPE
jgi:hypothetical protein